MHLKSEIFLDDNIIDNRVLVDTLTDILHLVDPDVWIMALTKGIIPDREVLRGYSKILKKFYFYTENVWKEILVARYATKDQRSVIVKGKDAERCGEIFTRLYERKGMDALADLKDVMSDRLVALYDNGSPLFLVLGIVILLSHVFETYTNGEIVVSEERLIAFLELAISKRPIVTSKETAVFYVVQHKKQYCEEYQFILLKLLMLFFYIKTPGLHSSAKVSKWMKLYFTLAGEEDSNDITSASDTITGSCMLYDYALVSFADNPVLMATVREYLREHIHYINTTIRDQGVMVATPDSPKSVLSLMLATVMRIVNVIGTDVFIEYANTAYIELDFNDSKLREILSLLELYAEFLVRVYSADWNAFGVLLCNFIRGKYFVKFVLVLNIFPILLSIMERQGFEYRLASIYSKICYFLGKETNLERGELLAKVQGKVREVARSSRRNISWYIVKYINLFMLHFRINTYSLLDEEIASRQLLWFGPWCVERADLVKIGTELVIKENVDSGIDVLLELQTFIKNNSEIFVVVDRGIKRSLYKMVDKTLTELCRNLGRKKPRIKH